MHVFKSVYKIEIDRETRDQKSKYFENSFSFRSSSRPRIESKCQSFQKGKLIKTEVELFYG